MSLQSAIFDNIESLQDVIKTIQSLSGDQYTKTLVSSPIGMHVRHIIDHYHCLLNNLQNTYIDYDKRERNPSLEQSPEQAIIAINNIVMQLNTLNESEYDENTTLTITASTTVNETKSGAKSSLLRELLFLHSHTIHHCALIAINYKMLGINIDCSFGVSPSTLRHQQQN